MVDRDNRVRTAGVVGMGLIGTSLLMALREAGVRTVGFDLCPETVARIRARELVDVVAQSLAELAAPSIDMVFICVPPAEVVPTGEALFAAGAAFVTDVASVKTPVVVALGGRAGFLGGHPMAGGETAGPDGAAVDLFRGANWLLTATESTAPEVVERVVEVVLAVGARPVMLDPATHDRCVALVSHLPHVAAAALASVIAHDRKAVDAGRLVAKGWLDTTRIASGPAGLWTDILHHNAGAVITAIDALMAELARFRASLQARDLDALHDGLDCAATSRDALVAGASAGTGAGAGGHHLVERRAARAAAEVRSIPACTCGLRAAG